MSVKLLFALLRPVRGKVRIFIANTLTIRKKMETNINTGQPEQQPVQSQLQSELQSAPMEPVQFQAEPEPFEPEQTEPTLEPTSETPLLYNPEKAARIANYLRELLDPAYILLFGTLAGGTPHSDTCTYDLLVIVDGTPVYNWDDARRYLRMKLPRTGHGAPYLNIYVHTLHEVDANVVPFLYLARREGIVLYRDSLRKFKRPRRKFDFGQAAADARRYAGAFLPLAGELTGYAEKTPDRESVRKGAFAMAQAAAYYYRTLFYAYHGFEAGTSDVGLLQRRLRTISGELPLLFEPASDDLHTLYCLRSFLVNARDNPDFFIHPEELAQHLDRVKRFGEVVNKLCERRIELYKSLIVE